MFFNGGFLYLLMELPQIDPDKSIFQSNAITSGRYDFTACQLDILFMLLALLDKGDETNKVYPIYVKDIEAITGRTWQYNQLKDATEEMGSRVFSVETKKSFKQIWFFQMVEYQTGKGYFDVKLSEDIRPYLFDLKDNFTVIQLKSALLCSSKYAKRLYTLCCQWRSLGIISIPISDLKEKLFLKDPKGKEPEQFARITQFREKVLEIAKRQINKNTDIEFDFEICNKRGPHVKKNYDTVKLFIGRKKEIQMEINFKEPIQDQKDLAQITAYGIGEVVAKRILKAGRMEDFRKEVADLLLKLKEPNHKIKDATAYLVAVLKKKGFNMGED